MHERKRLLFEKTGAEIKTAVEARISQISSRLERRNKALDEFMEDRSLVRSYLVRSSRGFGSHGQETLWSGGDISGEQLVEIRQLCNRIYVLEDQLRTLQRIVKHIDTQKVFELNEQDMEKFGFDELD